MASNFIQDYVETLIEREIGAAIPSVIAPVTPFIARPDALDFETKRRKDFPLPSEFRDVVVPKVETEVTPQQDGGDDPPPSIEITDIVGGLDDYNIKTETKPTDFKSRLADAIGQKIDFEYSVELASAEKRASGLGSGVFAKTVGLVPFGGLLSGFGEEQNKQRLEVIAAQAALGVPNFGIGRVNNQTVGMGLDVFGNPGSRALTGTLPQGITTQQREEIRDAIEGKSGALGPARAEYLERGGRFDMSKPQTSAMLGFENVVVGSTLPSSLKEALLGFDRLTNPFELARMPSNYYTVTPFEQIQIDREQAAKNRAGDVGSGFTDVSAPSMGLEGDVAAQDNQITPTAINVGIDMDNISGVPTGISLDAGGGPTSALDVSSAVSLSYYSDNESGDNQTSGGGGSSGFGGGGWTAYGGKIGMSNGGFASKTTKIKGVGLIKPEQTFMDTDMVDDRFEFDAEEGDFIVNGPASQRMKPQVNALINYGMDELRKEGVDIRVGNPKIKSKNKVPLIVASSETYIPRIIAEKIGYPILDALNDTGKPEVARLKRKLDNEPTDKSKYQANEGMRVGDPRQGFLFGSPRINVTGPSIDKSENVFVPGISDEPIEMKPDDERFFNYYSLRDIKDAIYEKEMKGYEGRGYIFTGVAPDYKNKKSSSAFGKFQITYSTLQDFKDRSSDYKALEKEEKKYVDDLIQQGKDKVNLDLKYGLRRKGKIVPMSRVSKNLKNKLKGLRQGVIPQETHEKYYDKIADLVLRQKLKDYKNKGIRPFLESYGEGEKYGEDVYNILLDKIQIKDLDNNSSATQ